MAVGGYASWSTTDSHSAYKIFTSGENVDTSCHSGLLIHGFAFEMASDPQVTLLLTYNACFNADVDHVNRSYP